MERGAPNGQPSEVELASVVFFRGVLPLVKILAEQEPGPVSYTHLDVYKRQAEHGFDLRISGEPSMWYMRITNDDNLVLHQEWVAECVRRGVFFTSHHNLFMNLAVTDADIAHTLEVAHEAFGVGKANHPELG